MQHSILDIIQMIIIVDLNVEMESIHLEFHIRVIQELAMTIPQLDIVRMAIDFFIMMDVTEIVNINQVSHFGLGH